MFDFFKKNIECPVTSPNKEWIENGMLWFRTQLGDKYLLERKFIAPTYIINDSYSGNEEEVRKITKILIKFLELNIDSIKLEIINDEKILFDQGFRDGTWKSIPTLHQKINENQNITYIIYLNSEKFKDVIDFIDSLLYHLLAIKFKIDFPTVEFKPPLIELSSIFYGTGILWANSRIIYKKWKGIRTYGWKIKKNGLLSQQAIGYALALYTLFRKEKNPEWKIYLSPDIKKYFQKSLDFISQKKLPEFLLEKLNTTEKFQSPDYLYESSSYYDNGEISIVSEMKNGYRDGVTKYYHRNGKLWAEWIYKNGIPFTVISNYDSKGIKRERGTLSEGNGSLYSYNADDSIAFIQNFVNGKPMN